MPPMSTGLHPMYQIESAGLSEFDELATRVPVRVASVDRLPKRAVCAGLTNFDR